jgi:hypothetical protein
MHEITQEKLNAILEFEVDYHVQYMPGTVGFFSLDNSTELAHIRLNGPAAATFWVNSVD